MVQEIRSEILSRRSYFLGNFIAERYFFLGNIIAAMKFDRSRCHGNQRLLSMTTRSFTPRSQSPAVTSGRAPLESVAPRVGDCYAYGVLHLA